MPPSEIRKEARESLAGKWGKAVCIILAYLLISFAMGFVQSLFEENSSISSIIDIAIKIVSVPLSFGLLISFINLKRGETVSAFDFLKEGFSRFGKSWGILFHTFLKLWLPLLCLVVLLVVFSVFIIANIPANLSNTVASSINKMSGSSLFTSNVSLSQANVNNAKIACLSLAFTIIFLAIIVYVYARSLLYVLAYYISYDNSSLSSKECVLRSEDYMKGNRGNIFLLQLSFIGWSLLACLTFGIGLLWLAPYMQVAEVCFYEKVVNKKAKKIE